MKRALSIVTASLVISLATSAYAQSTVPDVSSKIIGSTVSTAQLPSNAVIAKMKAEKREARKEEARKDAMRRKEAKQDKRAEERRIDVKDQVLAFRNQHPVLAHEVLMHKPWLLNHGISPVKAIRNPEMLRDRVIARRGK